MTNNTNTTLSTADLLAQKLAAKMAAAKEKAQQDLVSNERFLDSMVDQMLREEATTALNGLVAQCKTIVDTNKVTNRTTGEARTWRPTKVYGYGNQLVIISELLNGIQYSVQEHTDLLLAATDLSADLVERTLSALGSTSYYSVNNSVIVEGTAPNIPELISCVTLLEHRLGITIDKTLLTQATADRLELAAYAKAERIEAETTLANQLHSQYVIK